MADQREQTICKYELPITDIAEVMLPQGARVLRVGEQNNVMYLWALVSPRRATTPRRFRVAGTGHPLSAADLGPFLGTVMLHGGWLVFHVFELRED